MVRKAIVAAALVLAGPAWGQVAPDPYRMDSPVREELSIPLGVEFTVSAGDTIVHSRKFRMVPGAELLATASSPPSWSDKIALPAGAQLFQVASSKPFKACSVVLNTLGYPSCLIDDDGDGDFDRIAINDVAGAKPMPKPAAYQRQETIIPPPTPGFERVVLYQGATSDGLNLGYREFKDDLARAAFQETLSIPMTKDYPQQFAIKGLVFTVLSVGPLGMRLRLDSVDRTKGWPTPAPVGE